MIFIGEVTNESGIYQIENITNGKIYVGSSINLRVRYTSHKNRLKNRTHDNEHLQSAWNKYGEESFYFSILEFVSDKNKLIEREQYWIDTLNVCDREKGYNNSPTAGNCFGFKHSYSNKIKMRMTRHNNKAILQFDTKGNLLKEWISVSELSREIDNLTESAVRRRINNRFIINGSYFIYKDEFSDELLKEVLVGKEIKRGRPKSKRVNQYDLDGNLIKTWDSISLASKTLGVSKGNIGSCCNGKHNYKSVGGFIWRFAD